MNEAVRFGGLVLLIVVFLSLLVWVLSKKFYKSPICKLIPTFIIWIISIVFFFLGISTTKPMQDLGYFIMSMITGVATFFTLVVTIIINKYIKYKQKPNRNI